MTTVANSNVATQAEIRALTTGAQTFTVGAKGDYTTIQAAVNAAMALPQFTALKSISGATCTVTQGSKTVLFTGAYGGDLTNDTSPSPPAYIEPINNGDRYFSISSGATKKWYPVTSIVDNTHLLLACPYQEATATTAADAWWSGRPNTRTIEILEDHDELPLVVFVTPNGTDSTTQFDEIALRFTCRNSSIAGHVLALSLGYTTAIAIGAKSGLVIFDEMHSDAPRKFQYLSLVTSQPDQNPVVEYKFFNNRAKGALLDDTIYLATGGTKASGTFEMQGGFYQGNVDVIIPANLSGLVTLNNVISRSLPKWQTATIGGNNPLTTIFGGNNGIFFAKDSTFWTTVSGSKSALATCVNFSTGTGHTFLFDGCTFILDATPGGAMLANVIPFLLQVLDCDIYFINCRCILRGTVTPQAAWKTLATSSLSGTPNRIYFRNTIPFDLPNDLVTGTVGTIVEFSGAKGRIKALSQPIVAVEFDYLRGDTFTMTLTAARTMSPIINAPDGSEITFILTQGGAGGFATTWDATMKFVSAWSETGNTTGKVSTVTFRKSGSNWYQISPQNAWT